MAMKRTITKTQFEALSDDMKKEYKADGETYVLDLEDYEDPGELRRARDREKQAAQAAKEELATLKQEIDDAKSTGHAKKGDIEALEKSYKEKMLKLEEKLTGTVKQRESFIRKSLRDNVAKELANKISTSPQLLVPHLLARLDVDLDGDEPATRVLGLDGKPSALSIAELEAEFVANKDFSAIITASKASGGGASGNQGGGAAKKPSEYSEKERIELFKSDPVKFKTLFPSQI
jgi:hypothetical protein